MKKEFTTKDIFEASAEAVKQERKRLKAEIELLIADEALIARQEGQATSRLTSLFNKINKIL